MTRARVNAPPEAPTRSLHSERELAAVRPAFRANTLRNLRYLGQGPPFYRIGRSIFYDLAEVDAWIDACRVEPGKTA